MSTLERPAAGTNRSVPPGRALAITYRVVLRQLTSRGRIIALTLLALVSTIAGFALGQGDADLDDSVQLIASARPGGTDRFVSAAERSSVLIAAPPDTGTPTRGRRRAG